MWIWYCKFKNRYNDKFYVLHSLPQGKTRVRQTVWRADAITAHSPPHLWWDILPNNSNAGIQNDTVQATIFDDSYQQKLGPGLGCANLHLKYLGKQESLQSEECSELSSEPGKDMALVTMVLEPSKADLQCYGLCSTNSLIRVMSTRSVICLARICAPPPPHMTVEKLPAGCSHGSNYYKDNLHSKIGTVIFWRSSWRPRFVKPSDPWVEFEH